LILPGSLGRHPVGGVVSVDLINVLRSAFDKEEIGFLGGKMKYLSIGFDNYLFALAHWPCIA